MTSASDVIKWHNQSFFFSMGRRLFFVFVLEWFLRRVWGKGRGWWIFELLYMKFVPWSSKIISSFFIANVSCKHCWNFNSSQSQLVEKAVYELVDTMKGNLNAKEKAALAEGEGTSETDCYYALLNYFTQRNTEALVKCKSNSPQSYRNYLVSMIYSFQIIVPMVIVKFFSKLCTNFSEIPRFLCRKIIYKQPFIPLCLS